MPKAKQLVFIQQADTGRADRAFLDTKTVKQLDSLNQSRNPQCRFATSNGGLQRDSFLDKSSDSRFKAFQERILGNVAEIVLLDAEEAVVLASIDYQHVQVARLVHLTLEMNHSNVFAVFHHGQLSY